MNLVTGGSGFIGGHLVKALADRGEPVRVLDLKPPDVIFEEISGGGIPDGVTWTEGSVTDPDTVANAMEGVDAVFHVAGDARLWNAERAKFAETNAGGTKTVAAAARRAGVKRLVHTSSITAYVGRETRRTGPDVTEAAAEALAEGETLGPYSRSKWRAERDALAAAGDGLDVVIAAPSLPTGAGDINVTPPSRMLLDFLNGKTPAYVDCVLNIVDVRDLALGQIAARDRGRPGERYLMVGENLPMAAFLRLLEDVSGRKMPKSAAPFSVALGFAHLEEWFCDHVSKKPPKAPVEGVKFAGHMPGFGNAKAKVDLGVDFRPARDALSEALAWFEKKGWV